MYDFYTAIFDKVLEKESWQQLAFLNVQLQEAVGQRHPEDSNRYCLNFNSISSQRLSSFCCFSVIQFSHLLLSFG